MKDNVGFSEFYSMVVDKFKSRDCPVKRQIHAQLRLAGPPKSGWHELIAAAKEKATIEWSADEQTFIKNLGKGQGNTRLSIAIYFFFHSRYDDLSFAHSVDRIAFSGRTFDQVFGRPVIAREATGQIDLHLLAEHIARELGGVQWKAFEAEEPQLWLPVRLKFGNDQSNWLSPLVEDAIPFFGRAKEMSALDTFAAGPDKFSIWAIQGPSGSGKTRLVTHWMRRLVESYRAEAPKWNVGFLDRDAKKLWESGWKTWVPSKPTFMAVDYVYDSADVLDTLVRRWGKQSQRGELVQPVRILLIDHIFPTPLQAILRHPAFGGLSGGGADEDEKRDLIFDNSPLVLGGEEPQRDLLLAVMRSAAKAFGADIGDTAAAKAVAELATIKGAWCPLFAALRGRALAVNSTTRFGNRRDLIHYYLDTDNRLPWIEKVASAREVGEWVGCFIAAATANRGASFEALFNSLPNSVWSDNSSQTLKRTIVARCNSLVSSRDETRLAQFEPDILGETLFMLLVRYLNEMPLLARRRDIFCRMLSKCSWSLDETSEHRYSIEFVEFIQRLVRNLSNDDQEDGAIQRYWNALIKFMGVYLSKGEQFEKEVICVALTKAAKHLVASEHLDRAAMLVDIVEPDVLLAGLRTDGERNTQNLRIACLEYADLQFQLNDLGFNNVSCEQER